MQGSQQIEETLAGNQVALPILLLLVEITKTPRPFSTPGGTPITIPLRERQLNTPRSTQCKDRQLTFTENDCEELFEDRFQPGETLHDRTDLIVKMKGVT